LNGKFTDRGFRRSRRARPLYRWALGQFDALLMQSAVDAERALALGAPAERVGISGNTKFEQEAPAMDPARCDALRRQIASPAAAYALGEVVFIGGSLVPIGGHDILQPLLQGKPTLFGPHMHNQREVASLALEANACIQVDDADQLADAVARCLLDPAHARRLA